MINEESLRALRLCVFGSARGFASRKDAKLAKCFLRIEWRSLQFGTKLFSKNLISSVINEVGEVDGYWPGAPDLVIEVISPSDTYTEVEEKVFEWLKAGVRMVIVVNSRKRITTVYRSLTDIVILTEDDYLEGGDVIPGWKLAVKDLFE